MHQIRHGILGDRRAQAQSRRATHVSSGGALGGAQVAAGSRIGPLRCVRCPRRVQDLPPAAVTLIEQSSSTESVDHRVIAIAMRRLPQWFLVPGDSDRGQVGQLALGDIGVGAVVQILDPDQEPAIGRPGEQPRQRCGAKVADVQIGRRAGCEPSGARRRHGVHRRKTYDDGRCGPPGDPATGPDAEIVAGDGAGRGRCLVAGV